MREEVDRERGGMRARGDKGKKMRGGGWQTPLRKAIKHP